MANRAITKKISALPTYALNNNNGNLLYSEGGANYQFPLSNIALLSNLGLGVGFGNIGRALYSEIRNYQGSFTYIHCRGITTTGDGGEGIFRLVPSDTTTVDNNCTILVDALGRRWKREFTGNIKGEWANIKTTAQSSSFQDDAFDNLLLAAAAASDSGYPQRIIEMPKGGSVKLGRLHTIRCGVYVESDDWVPSNNLGTRFGIIGKFILDGPAGFFVVQANSPYFDIEVDNTGVTYVVTPTVDNYFLRMEAMVMNPEFHIKSQNYPGTPLYSLGKGATADVSAIWPSLTTVLPSIQNINHATLRVNSSGRSFYLKNTGSGFGHITSVWEQNNTYPSQLVNMYDVSLDKYEDYVPPLQLTGGLIIDTCGTITIGELLIGSGGGPHVRIWDTPAIAIGRIFAVDGGPTYAQTVANAYALEICNSRVQIGEIDSYYPGEFLRAGYNAWVGIGSINGWYMSRVVRQVNDTNYLAYRGSRVGQVNDVCEVIVDKACFYNLNYYAGGYAAQSLFYVDSSVPGGELTLNNVKFRNTHSGWTGTTEAQTYIVEVQTTSNTFFFNSRNTKWSDNNFNYVIYLAKEYQLGDFQSNQTDYARIRYASGNQSTFGMRDAPHPDLGTTPLTIDGSNFVYGYRRPGKYSGQLTLAASSTATVAVNGQTLYSFSAAGTYSINLKLYFQEIVVITVTGTVSISGSSWRYTV